GRVALDAARALLASGSDARAGRQRATHDAANHNLPRLPAVWYDVRDFKSRSMEGRGRMLKRNGALLLRVGTTALACAQAALARGGSVVTFGMNDYGQCNAPTPNVAFVAVAGGERHSLGLKADGSIVAWGAGGPGQSGWPHYGQSVVPLPNANFVAIAAGAWHSLALRGGGSVVARGAGGLGEGGV